MKKINKPVFYTAGGVLCLVILFLAIKFIIDSPYRSKLPDLPDMTGSPAPLNEQISDASEKAHRNPTAENIGKLGMVYHSSAYYDKASECYKLAIKRNHSNWIWSYYLGFLNREMGESNGAIENFRDVIKVEPKAYHAWYYVGEGYQNLGETYKAEVAFGKIANLKEKMEPEKASTRNDYFPLRAYSMFQLSRIYISSNRADLAEETLKQILMFHRSFGPAYRLLGTVYSQRGNTDLSRYNIVRANDLADYTPPVDTLIDKLALLSRSELYLLKQIDEAEKAIYPEWALVIGKNALKQLPDNKYLISKTIKLFLKLDLGNQALPYLDKHISYYTGDYNEIKEIADLLSDKGFYSQSLIYYNLAIKLKPADFELHTSMALALANAGMKQNAVSQVTDLLEKANDNTVAISEGISFFITAGDRDKAVLYLDRLKKLSPANPKVAKYSGMIAENDGKVTEAIGFYESAFKTDTTDLTTIRYLGNILIRQKMWEKAIGHYRKALQYYPNEPNLLQRLGALLVSCPDKKLRDYNAAKEYSERAFIHTGCPGEVLISAAKSLSEAYGALGDKNNAYTFLNITLSLARNQNAPKEFIADLEKKLKQFSSSD